MVTLLSPLQCEVHDGRATLALWLCQPFDEHYSFRAALAEIEQALGNASHELPEEYPMEDFVHGVFRWELRQFALYYERSLGYLEFSSESSSDLEALHAFLLPVTRVSTRQMFPESRLSLGMLSPVLGVFFAACIYITSTWQPPTVGDRIAKFAVEDILFTFIALCGVGFIAAMVGPQRIQPLILRVGGKASRAGVALMLGTVVYLVYCWLKS